MVKQATAMLLLGTALVASSCKTMGVADKPVIPVSGGTAELQAEVVATPESRERGLMHRTDLGENEGMLFVYPDKGTRAFWMMNTPLPLSIAFLEDDGTVVNIEDMAPADPGPRYVSAKPVRYALEVHQGWFLRNGVAPGTVLRFKLPDSLEIR